MPGLLRKLAHVPMRLARETQRGVLPHFHGRFEKGWKLQILPGDSTTHSWVMKPLDVVE